MSELFRFVGLRGASSEPDETRRPFLIEAPPGVTWEDAVAEAADPDGLADGGLLSSVARFLEARSWRVAPPEIEACLLQHTSGRGDETLEVVLGSDVVVEERRAAAMTLVRSW